MRLLIGYLDQNLGETEVVLEPIGNGSFRVDGSQLSLAGGWEIVAAIRFRAATSDGWPYPLLTMGAGPATFVSQPTLFDRAQRKLDRVVGSRSLPRGRSAGPAMDAAIPHRSFPAGPGDTSVGQPNGADSRHVSDLYDDGGRALAGRLRWRIHSGTKSQLYSRRQRHL